MLRGLLLKKLTIPAFGDDLYCNTLCYSSPNHTQITIISGLGMHDVTGLIHSKSSQRQF
jgi:hypothetical protein